MSDVTIKQEEPPSFDLSGVEKLVTIEIESAVYKKLLKKANQEGISPNLLALHLLQGVHEGFYLSTPAKT